MGIIRKVMIVSLALFASSAFAGDKNPWTKCGIGAMIFDETTWAAAISNIIWDLGTTAVTSAQSSEETCDGKDVQAAMFIQETYANLEEETAKGGGQHTTAMLNILGCDEAAHSNIIQSVRGNFAESISGSDHLDKTTQQKAANYYEVVTNKVNSEFSAQCQMS